MRTSRPSRPRTSLQDVSFTAGGPIGRAIAASAQPESALWRNLEEASRIIRATEATPPGEIDDVGPMSAEFERIRWFPLPGEALDDLRADAHLGREAGADPTESSAATVSGRNGR